MNDLSKMWRSALMEIQCSVSYANFSTWFKDTTILREEEGTIYIGVPNSFTQEWLEKKFHRCILRTLRRMDQNICDIQYVIARDCVSVPRLLDVRNYRDVGRVDDLKKEIKTIIDELIGKLQAVIDR